MMREKTDTTEEMTMSKYSKMLLLIATAPFLFVWEVFVWLCQQVVKLDKMLDEPLERFTEWANK